MKKQLVHKLSWTDQRQVSESLFIPCSPGKDHNEIPIIGHPGQAEVKSRRWADVNCENCKSHRS